MLTVAEKRFDLCPHCGQKMVYMIYTSTIGIPDDVGGRFLKRESFEDKQIHAYCTNCDKSYEMVSSVLGITTKDFNKYKEYVKERDEKLDNNPIGRLMTDDD